MNFALEPALTRAPRSRGRALPCVPKTDWKPGVFANLSSAKVIAIDLETYDPQLLTKGPGWARHDGHIVGFSVGTEDGFRGYYPIRHTVNGHENLDAAKALLWLRDQLSGVQAKIGANILYDLGWLAEEGIAVGGMPYDVQFAEALLTEDASTALETLGQKYCNEGKASHLLYEWCAAAYGGEVGGGQRANIYRAPPSLVGPYAESDVDLPLRVFEKQWPALVAQNLQDVFAMECGLLPLMLRMRMEGVAVDLDGAERMRTTLIEGQRRLQERLDAIAGHVDVNASDSISKAFDALGLEYPRTEKTSAPSFVKKWLEAHPSQIAQMILAVRRVEKLRTTFVEGSVLNAHVNGRVHGQFHLLRKSGSDDDSDGGTRSGRLSGSTPNLQQIPSRAEDERAGYVKALRDVGIGNLAPMLRALFQKERGHKQWRKDDYSGIEYRMLVHFATGPGSDAARAQFCADPDTDFHGIAMDAVAPIAGWDISTPALRKQWRPLVKNFGFGTLYAMGKTAMAELLHLDMDAANALSEAYHKGMPYVKTTANHYSRHAEQYGEIQTVMGRKSRFEKWEPKVWTEGARALPYGQAVAAYGSVRRAECHKALNRVLQGSAADLMKMAMLQCYRSGVFDYIGYPKLTVHDELDFSDPGGKDDGFAEMKRIMETAIPLRLPVRCETEVGPDWGHTKKA